MHNERRVVPNNFVALGGDGPGRIFKILEKQATSTNRNVMLLFFLKFELPGREPDTHQFTEARIAMSLATVARYAMQAEFLTRGNSRGNFRIVALKL